MCGVAGLAALAGCGAPGPGPDEVEEGETPEHEDPGGPDAGDEEQHDVDEEDWADVEEIHLEAYEDGWEGVEPEAIAGEVNPNVGLEVGRQYTMSFENADGEPHTLEVWSDPEDVIAATDEVDEEGESASIEFEATEDADRYVCGVHDDVMQGMVVFLGGTSES